MIMPQRIRSETLFGSSTVTCSSCGAENRIHVHKKRREQMISPELSKGSISIRRGLNLADFFCDSL